MTTAIPTLVCKVIQLPVGWLAYNWKKKKKSHYSVSTSKLFEFLQLHWLNADIIQGGIKDLELHTNLKMKLRGWQFFLCLGKKEKNNKNHSALIAKLQHIYTWWVRPQKTTGLLVQEYSLINPDFPYDRRNTDSFIPSIALARQSFHSFSIRQLSVAVPAKRRRHQAEMVIVENPNRMSRL